MNDTQFKSEVLTADNGAKVELATVTFEGRDFTAIGSCVDEEHGLISAYVSGIPGAYKLTTWAGNVLAPLTLKRTWKNRNVFGGYPVTMYAWSAVVGGVKYSGRNSGPQTFVRMRAGKAAS